MAATGALGSARLSQRCKPGTHQIDTGINNFTQAAGEAVVTPRLHGHHKSCRQGGSRDLRDEVEVGNSGIAVLMKSVNTSAKDDCTTRRCTAMRSADINVERRSRPVGQPRRHAGNSRRWPTRHQIVHPDLMGPNRPGPTGFIDLPIPIDGLYLARAGCHGGPGITFTPGYNAAYQVLDDVGGKSGDAWA